MLSYNEVTQRKFIIVDGDPFEVLSSHVFRKQQRKPVNQTKLRNLITGKVTERAFHQAETIQEASIETKPFTYLYSNRGEFWFSAAGNPKDRFSVSEAVVGVQGKFLKTNEDVEALVFNDTIIGFKFPIKVDLKVTVAPPAVKGNTAQGGNKQIELEGGAVVSAPLFISEGDIVRINTETGEYVERVEKK